MTEVELRTLKVMLNNRLKDHLDEMESGLGDSIIGFNEAWEIVDLFFEDKIEALKRPT